tara:strand:- start:63277 stop:63486 length:210 start_codon:yes stop_codon:yes gene_type:complete
MSPKPPHATNGIALNNLKMEVFGNRKLATTGCLFFLRRNPAQISLILLFSGLQIFWGGGLLNPKHFITN